MLEVPTLPSHTWVFLPLCFNGSSVLACADQHRAATNRHSLP